MATVASLESNNKEAQNMVSNISNHKQKKKESGVSGVVLMMIMRTAKNEDMSSEPHSAGRREERKGHK